MNDKERDNTTKYTSMNANADPMFLFLEEWAKHCWGRECFEYSYTRLHAD